MFLSKRYSNLFQKSTSLMYLVIELMQEAERSKVRRAAFKHHHLVLATLFCNLSRTSVTLQAEKVVVHITTGAASCGKMLHQVDLLSFNFTVMLLQLATRVVRSLLIVYYFLPYSFKSWLNQHFDRYGRKTLTIIGRG